MSCIPNLRSLTPSTSSILVAEALNSASGFLVVAVPRIARRLFRLTLTVLLSVAVFAGVDASKPLALADGVGRAVAAGRVPPASPEESERALVQVIWGGVVRVRSGRRQGEGAGDEGDKRGLHSEGCRDENESSGKNERVSVGVGV